MKIGINNRKHASNKALRQMGHPMSHLGLFDKIQSRNFYAKIHNIFSLRKGNVIYTKKPQTYN